MFRYATLMLEELRQPSNETIADILNALPTGLNEMYERILLLLEKRHPKDIPLRKRIFLWVAMAYRPVTVEEMAYALATKDGEEDFDPSEKKIHASKKDMFRACGSLIEVFGNTLHFTHLSVKDFPFQSPDLLRNKDGGIQSFLVDTEQAHTSMALTSGMGRIFSLFLEYG
jgi:hypothetical protein